MAKENATDQAPPSHDENGKFAKGNKPITGFHTNPERRNPGGWKKNSTPRYKLEKMMSLPEADLKAVAQDKEAPLFERRLAIAIRNSDWKTIDSMINQVYGKPKESVDVTTKGESINAYRELTAEELRKLASGDILDK